MTKKSAECEKKRNMWRGHKILFPIAVTTLVACGVGFFAVYSCGFFVDKPIIDATFYVFLFIFSFSFLIVYLAHYFISGKDKRGHWQCVSRAWVCAALLMVFAGSFDVYNTRCFVNTAPQIELEVWIGGILSLLGLVFLIHRTANQDEQLENQSKQLEIQTNKEIDDRFIVAVELLGNNETSARTGAIYSLYELAKDSKKYRKQIAQILCSHIRSKTQNERYQAQHETAPSNEIQTIIDVLFRNVNGVMGLYCHDFAKEKDFPTPNLSRAYLYGAYFVRAQCRKADFSFARCQKAKFMHANCDGAFFYSAKCRGAFFNYGKFRWADFADAELQNVQFYGVKSQGADFRSAQCQSSKFLSSQCQSADFSEAQLQEVDFISAQCQGANFRDAQCQGTNFYDAQCQGASFAKAECQRAIFSTAKCQGATFNFTALQFASLAGADFRGACDYNGWVPLEDRIGKRTEVENAIFSGPFSERSIEATKGSKLYCSDVWNSLMRGLLFRQETRKQIIYQIPKGVITGVLDDDDEIRAVVEEIKKYKRN